MTNIKSYNSSSTPLVRQIFVPDAALMFLYFISSFFILSLVNVRAIWVYLTGTSHQKQQAVDLFNHANNIQDSSGILGGTLQGRVSQIIIWGFIGVVIYALIWFIKNILTNVRNDVVADEYVHPHSYNRRSYWTSVLSRKIFFALMLLIVAGFAYLVFKLFPTLSNMYLSAIYGFNARSIVELIASAVALAVLMHVFVVLIRMTINAWRFIYADL